MKKNAESLLPPCFHAHSLTTLPQCGSPHHCTTAPLPTRPKPRHAWMVLRTSWRVSCMWHLTGQVAVNAKRVVNQSFLFWYKWTPPQLRCLLVSKGDHNRSYAIVPTCHGGVAMFCIALVRTYCVRCVLFPLWCTRDWLWERDIDGASC